MTNLSAIFKNLRAGRQLTKYMIELAPSLFSDENIFESV